MNFSTSGLSRTVTMAHTLLLFRALTLWHLVSVECTPSTTKPNIVFIMADDLGWGNVGYHNELNDEINTPVIDQLVAEGLELDRHYAFAGCSPSRASFQSGRLPIHLSVRNRDGLVDPTHGMPSAMTGFATKLKEGGYHTHLVGKWDVGFATKDKLPISKGYDSFYGYLGKSVTYFSKKGDGLCNGLDYRDFWEDDHPVVDSAADLEDDKYIEFMFADRVNEIISGYGHSEHEDEDQDEGPFLLFYSMHLPHYPSEIPEEYLQSFDDDINDCQADTASIYPGYSSEEFGADFQCRSITQSQVNLMDALIGGIVDNLKASNLWDDTLLIFTSDNGGSLELTKTAANNYPLRGGKVSMWEGGVRTVSFVSGGYLPEPRRGQKEKGLMHLADWYSTFCGFAGVEATDSVAIANGLPDVDGVDLWPLISGQVSESPRSDVALGPNAYISGRFKLHVHSVQNAVLQEPKWPNQRTASQSEIKATVTECDWERPCLFDIFEDPSETEDIAGDRPDVVTAMKAAFQTISEGIYENELQGTDSCPASLNTEELSCGCWMAIVNYNLFVGPYQDLEEGDKHWSEQDEDMLMDADYLWSLANEDRPKPPQKIVYIDEGPEGEQKLSGKEAHFSKLGAVWSRGTLLSLELRYYAVISVAGLMACVLIFVFKQYFKEMQLRIKMGNPRSDVSIRAGYGAL